MKTWTLIPRGREGEECGSADVSTSSGYRRPPALRTYTIIIIITILMSIVIIITIIIISMIMIIITILMIIIKQKLGLPSAAPD